MQDRPAPQGIQSIEVGARVLLALERGKGPLPLAEIARRSGMPPAKAHRYLASLVRTGLAARDAAGRYDLGPAARVLGVEALRRSDPVSVASAYAVELRDVTGHTVNVAVWSEEGPVIVRWDTGTHVLPIAMRVGSVLPLVESAVGQVFLAHLPPHMTLSTHGRHRGVSAPITERQRREVVARVLEDGFGRSDRMVLGEGALAAPVFGADGLLELVIGLALPSGLMDDDAVAHLGSMLCSTAARVSRALGQRAA